MVPFDMRRNIMQAKLKSITAAAFGVALALALPWQSAEAAKLAGRSVKTGVMAPLTGKGAEWGQAGKASTELAEAEINAAGGIGGVPL